MEGNIKNTLKKWWNKKIQDWKKTQEQQNREDALETIDVIIDCFTEDQLKDLSINTKSGTIIPFKDVLLFEYSGQIPSCTLKGAYTWVNLQIKESSCPEKPIPITLNSFKKLFSLNGDPKNLVKREKLKRKFKNFFSFLNFLKPLISLIWFIKSCVDGQ